VLIHLTCLKHLKVPGGIKEKSFRFSNSILSVYSLSLFKAYFTTRVAWRASPLTLFTILVKSKLGFFLNFLNS